MDTFCRTFPVWLALALSLGLSACGKRPAHPVTRETRLEWNLRTTVAAYELNGSTYYSWDGPATNALIEFARYRCQLLDPGENSEEIIRTNCEAAMRARCDDPLIEYLYARFGLSQTNTPQAFADALSKASDDLEASSYPTIRKLYAAIRAAEQLKYATGGSTNANTIVFHYRHLAMTNLALVVADPATPVEEVYDACRDTFSLLEQNSRQYTNCYASIAGLLLANWPDESATWLVRGVAQERMAWFARGGGYADSVSAEGWAAFSAGTAEAEKCLRRAWDLNPRDPRIPNEILMVCIDTSQSRDQMEVWFNRAMELDPADYNACSSKLRYLLPRWFGSNEATLEFGRQCVQSPQYRGTVPYILVEAHNYICNDLDAGERESYWKRPEVWADLQSAYERLLALNPQATGYHDYYLQAAYRAGQWHAFNDLLNRIGTVNYDYFGGKDRFDEMVRHAAKADHP